MVEKPPSPPLALPPPPQPPVYNFDVWNRVEEEDEDEEAYVEEKFRPPSITSSWEEGKASPKKSKRSSFPTSVPPGTKPPKLTGR